MSKIKILGIFGLGVAIGGAAGAITSYILTKKQCDKKASDEVAELREHYEKKMEELEAKLPKEEVEPDSDKDGIVTVGKGIPEEKKVDTHATDYDKKYKDIKKRVKEVQDRVQNQAAPSEDDGEEPAVYEISEDGKDGYGRRNYYDCIEAEYYAIDGGFKVTNWNTILENYPDQTDEAFAKTEDELINDICPFLREQGFDEKPYDIVYVRDNNLSIDLRIVKIDGKGGGRDY